jgi:prepilin-type N-terminal cleavage/methylation domain-containing protein
MTSPLNRNHQAKLAVIRRAFLLSDLPLSIQHGVTLIELLIALAIIGLIGAIAIPLVMNAVNRSKQAKTMADIRTVATAWETRAAEKKSYNAAGATAATFSIPPFPVSSGELTGILAPTYIRAFPVVDGWNHPLDFAVDQPLSSNTPAQVYSIRSPGRNGAYEGSGNSYKAGPTTNFDCDIIFSGGSFIVYPEGRQSQ